jgi:hypothetical protein
LASLPHPSTIGAGFNARLAAATSSHQKSNDTPSESNHRSTGNPTDPDVAAHRNGLQINALVQEQDRVDAISSKAQPLTARCNASVTDSKDPADKQTPHCAADACGCPSPIWAASSSQAQDRLATRVGRDPTPYAYCRWRRGLRPRVANARRRRPCVRAAVHPCAFSGG